MVTKNDIQGCNHLCKDAPLNSVCEDCYSLKLRDEAEEQKDDIKRIYHELSLMGSQLAYLKTMIEEIERRVK